MRRRARETPLASLRFDRCVSLSRAFLIRFHRTLSLAQTTLSLGGWNSDLSLSLFKTLSNSTQKKDFLSFEEEEENALDSIH